MDVLNTAKQTEWESLLSGMFQFDSYHTCAFHQVAERRGEGKAYLYLLKESGYTIALPLLLREIDGILSTADIGWKDATSVYGYAGPVASHPKLPESVVRNFWESLRKRLVEDRVISVFTRLNPLIPQRHLLPEYGELCSIGKTVSIDLTLHPDLQRKQYRLCHKRGIKKLIKSGFVCIQDQEHQYLPQFVEAYTDTMRRVCALESYFFDIDYFHSIFDHFGSAASLFIVLHGDEVASGGLFVASDGILQYHLGGTAEKYLKLAPAKLIVDTVREWGINEGHRVLHLGGGVGSRDDSLLHFKTGFSDQLHEFQTWRWITDAVAYGSLCERYHNSLQCRGLQIVSEDYFPGYRAPAVAIDQLNHAL